MATKNVFIAPRSFDKTTGQATARLLEAGCALTYWEGEGRPGEEALIAALHDADANAAIIGLEPVTARVLDAAPRLRVVGKYGVGLDNIDLAAARARGIWVTWTPDASTNSVAELTVALMLALARRVPEGDRIVKRGGWERVVGVELSGKTVGLVGLGRIGRRVAALLAGFGVRLLATELVQDAAFAAQHGITYVPLEELLGESDFVSLHVPLTDTTHALIDTAALARMKPTAYLVNTARGGLVDEAALAEALRAGWLAGVATDVYATEPPASSPLLALDEVTAARVIATPHTGAHSQDAINAVSVQTAENIIAVLEGRRPPFPAPGFEGLETPQSQQHSTQE